MRVVDLTETFSRFADAWSPKIVGDVNDMHVKVVKLRGEFVWHHHDAEDELFLVVAGRLRMQLRDGDRDVGPGQFIIVPRGIEHCPKALSAEVHVALNTGEVKNERTVEHPTACRTSEPLPPPHDGNRVAKASEPLARSIGRWGSSRGARSTC